MYEYTAKIDRVIDGDTADATINVGFNITIQHRLRLLGVNAAELHSHDQVEHDKALRAKAMVEDAVESAKRRAVKLGLVYYAVIKTEKDDAFGRYLADVLLITEDGATKNLSDELLKAGLAVPYTRKKAP